MNNKFHIIFRFQGSSFKDCLHKGPSHLFSHNTQIILIYAQVPTSFCHCLKENLCHLRNHLCWRLSTFCTCALQQIAQVHSVKQYVSFPFSPKYKLHLKKSMQILLVLNVLGRCAENVNFSVSPNLFRR